MTRFIPAALLPAIVLVLIVGPSFAAGPLSVSADDRALIGPRGHSVFLQGATPWHILARLDRAESVDYLEARQAQGFNALLLSILVNDDFSSGSFDNAFGDPPFDIPNDFSTPNEAYFAHVDWFLEQARQRGFHLLLAPAYIGWGCQVEGFCQAMQQNGVDKMRDYGRFLGERYGNFENIIWIDGGDADAAAHGALDVVEAVAEGILETSPDQLHTAHCDRFNSAADCYDRPWLDLNNTYADCNVTPQELRADYERNTRRPFVFLEGFYEGEHETSATCLRSQAYWSLLGGAVGHFFGNKPMWDFLDGWRGALDSEGANSMREFRGLLHSRDWSRFMPDWSHEVLTAGFGSPDDGSYAAAARTENGQSIVIYTPEQRALTVDMSKVAGQEAIAWWFNPGNGAATFIQTLSTAGSHEFTPPHAGDWVLILDNANADLPTPGQGVATGAGTSGGLKSRYGGGR